MLPLLLKRLQFNRDSGKDILVNQNSELCNCCQKVCEGDFEDRSDEANPCTSKSITVNKEIIGYLQKDFVDILDFPKVLKIRFMTTMMFAHQFLRKSGFKPSPNFSSHQRAVEIIRKLC